MQKCLVVCIALGALVLAGCATQAQQQAQMMMSNSESALAQVNSCTTSIYNSPDYAPLRPHIPLDLRQVTLEQLADTRKITKSEVKAIYAVHPKLQSCRQNYLDQIVQTTPSLASIEAATFSRNNLDIVKLVHGKLTWGQFVERTQSVFAEGAEQLSTEAQRILAGLQQSHEAELARRQAAFNALAQYAQTQQMIDNMNRPTFTNCTEFGNTVNCVSTR